LTGFIRAVTTLYWRRIRLSFRNRTMMFVRLFQPFFWLVVLGTTFNNMFSAARSLPFQVDYLSFMAVGVMTMTVVFTSLFAGMSLVWDREFGVLKEFLAAPIPRPAIPVGNALAAATEGILQSLIILGLSVMIGARLLLYPAVLLAYIAVSFLISINLYGIAASVASRLTNTQSFMAIMNLLTMPLFFVSGAIYPIQFLPSGLREFAMVSPVTHTVALIRYHMLGPASSNLDAVWGVFGLTPAWLEAQLSLAYLAALSITALVVASLMFRRVSI
jgi:ABC-2 type transport system permease protein